MNPEIVQLATCDKFKAYCRQLTNGNDIYKDLINEVILILNDMSDIRSVESTARSVAWRQINTKGKNLNKMFASVGSDLLGIEVAEEEMDIEDEYSITVNVIEKDLHKSIAEDSFPVEYEVFKAYIKLGTIRKVSAFYGIPRSSVGRFLKNYRERIQKNIEK